MKVEFFTDVDVFDILKPEWNDLVQRSVTDTIFNTWEWHYHWWNAYQPGTLWVATLRTEDGENRLMGIAPWFIEQHPEHGRLVRCIGSEDVTDYLDIIVDRDCQQPVYDCLTQILLHCRNHYDIVDLCNIPAASPTCTYFPQILKHYSFTVETTQQEVCPIIRLPGTFEEYLEKHVDGKQRGEIRRKLRKANGYNASMGSLTWYIVNDSHVLDEEIERFITLMALSHPEKAAFLSNEQHVKFFKAIIPAALENGWLHLSFLMVDGEAAATYFSFDYNNHILVYNSGLNPRKFSELSPGIVLLAYNIRHAIQQKRETFDFLRGNEQYKYRMGAKDTAVYNLKAWLSD